MGLNVEQSRHRTGQTDVYLSLITLQQGTNRFVSSEGSVKVHCKKTAEVSFFFPGMYG